MRAIRPLILMLTTSTLPVSADAWLDFNGTIKGESTQKAHANWIEVTGFSIGSKLAPGSAGGFKVTKHADSATPKLYESATKGTTHRLVNVHLGSNDLSAHVFYRLELEHVLVTDFSTSVVSQGTAPEESIGLSFRKITYVYVLPDGKTKTIIYNHLTQKGTEGSEEPPENVDTDGDGMPDSWEISNGLNPESNDANADTDGDGLANINEYYLGTNPKAGNSFFKATLDTTGQGAQLGLSWNSVPGKLYLVEWTPDLKVPFTTLREVTGKESSTTIQVTREGTMGFYRVTPKP